METGDMSDFTNTPDTRAFQIWTAFVLFAFAFLGQTAQAAQTYTLADLGVFKGGTYSIARGLNAKGQAAGVAGDANGAPRAFLYDGGKLLDIAAASGASAAEAFALNDAGQATGYFLPPGETLKHAFIYQNGILRDLGPVRPGVAGDESQGADINAGGQITGYSVCNANAAQSAICPPDRAFFYDGAIHDPGELDVNYPRAYAYAINDRSQIAGVSFDGKGLRRAFLYDAGGMKDLGDLGAGGSVATDINKFGHVVGYADTRQTGANGAEFIVAHAFLYKNGAMRDLGALGGPFHNSEARGLNGKGQVVGVSGGVAFLYDGGKLYDLNALVADRQGWTLTEAVAVNDAGQILVNAVNAAGEKHAGLLTPANFSANEKIKLPRAAGDTADLSVVLIDSPDPVKIGDTLKYSATISNVGPSPATNVLLTVVLPNGVNFVSAPSNCVAPTVSGAPVVCTIANLGTNQNITRDILVTPTVSGILNAQATVSATEIDPNATATNTNNRSSITTTVQSIAKVDLCIQDEALFATNPCADDQTGFSASTNPQVGGSLTYTTTIFNNGPDIAHNVILTVTLPNGVNYVSSSAICAPANNPNINQVICNIGTLAAKQNIKPIIVVTPTIQGGLTAEAAVVALETEEKTNNNTRSITVQVSNSPGVGGADLLVNLTDTPDPVTVGNALTYIVDIVNKSQSTATNVQLSIRTQIPTLASEANCFPVPVSVPPSIAFDCNLGDIAGGGKVSTSFIGVTDKTGNITATATVNSDITDPQPTNNVTNAVTAVIQKSSDMAIALTATPNPVITGKALTYTAVMTNKGRSDATNVQLTLAVPSGVSLDSSSPGGCAQTGNSITCTQATLVSGASVIQTIAVIPSLEGNITSTATISAAEIDPDANNNQATVTVTSVKNGADLSATLVARNSTGNPISDTNPITVGDALNYTATISNNGPDNATNINMTMTLPLTLNVVSVSPGCTRAVNIVNCTAGSLKPGENINIVVATDTLAAGAVTTAFSASAVEADPDLTNNQAVLNTKISSKSADLNVGLTVTPSAVEVGSSLTYTATIGNKGPNNATEIQLTIALPAGMKLDSSIPTGCTQSGNTVVCSNIGNQVIEDGVVAPGVASGATFVQTVNVIPSLEGSVNATAAVAAKQIDPNPNDNRASVNASSVKNGADLSTLLVARNAAGVAIGDTNPVTVGDSIHYTATVTNGGPNNATSVALNFTLPVSLNVVSVSPGCTRAGNAVACTLGSLKSGASIAASVVAATTLSGSLTAAATASASEADPNLLNNQSVISSKVASTTADLSVDLTVDKTSVEVGGTLGYTAVISNQGPNTATDIKLTLALPAGVTLDSSIPPGCTQSGNTVACVNIGNQVVNDSGTVVPGIASGASFSQTIAVKPSLTGSVATVAIVSAGQIDPNPANNRANLTATATPKTVDLRVDVSALPSPATVGEKLTYTIIVFNNSSNDANNAQLTAILPQSVDLNFTPGGCTVSGNILSCSLGTIASGAKVRQSVEVTPKQLGNIALTVSVSSDEGDSSGGDNQSGVSTNVQAQIIDLAVSLLDSPDPVSEVFGTVTYTAIVSNNGPGDASNATVDINFAGDIDILRIPLACQAVSASAIRCFPGSLISGQTVAFNIVGQPKRAGTITASAAVSNPDIVTEIDSTTSNNNASAQTTVLSYQAPNMDLSVNLSATPTPVPIGNKLTYKASVFNNGPNTATHVRAVLTLPEFGVEFVSADQGCAPVENTVVCDFEDLIAGARSARSIVVKPTQDLALSGVVSVSAREADANAGNNVATLQTAVETGTTVPDANVSLLLRSPNGGEEWTVGSDRNIAWSLNGIDGRRQLGVSISKDGGATWKFLRQVASDSFDGLDWRVRDTYVGEHIRIRICLPKGRGVGRICDISDRDFSIAR